MPEPDHDEPDIATDTAHETEVAAAATAEGDCREWTGHVIVCGLHGVGMRTVEQLYLAGVRVVVVDDEPGRRLVPVLEGWGIPLIAGSSQLSEPLYAAGLEGALAIVCTEDSDLRTLETALLVRDLRADVRVVVHLDNPAVGRAIEHVTGEGSVLDIAELFAPSVVEACVGDNAHAFDLSGERCETTEVAAPRDGTLRELYGDLAPVAVTAARGGEITVCPGRDLMVTAGDRVTMVATPDALRRAGLMVRHEQGDAMRRAAGPLKRARRRLTEYLDRGVRITLWLTLAMVVASSLVLVAGYNTGEPMGMSVIEAVYFTIETAATVGFGDFSFADQEPWLQIFAILLILSGTTLVSMIFAFITNILVSRNIEQSFGYGRARGMHDHAVVIGLGSIGMRVLEGLVARGREVVVIERNEDNRYIARARALDVPVIRGDATLGQTLDAANLSSAAAVAIMTSDDLTNIETGLAVRDRLGARFDSVPVVLRVFDRSLGRRLEESFDFRHVWSAFGLSAPWFVGAAIGLDVVATFYVGNQPFLVGRLNVRDDGGLAGLPMQALSARIRVIAIRREGAAALEHTPRRDTCFEAGDEAFLAGPYEELLVVLRREQTASAADGGRA